MLPVVGALEWAGHSAEKADPYRQAVTFGDGRLFVAARGGGGVDLSCSRRTCSGK